MSQHVLCRATQHQVEHEYSGKAHFYKVTTPEGEEYDVSIQVGCDCKFFAVQGAANAKICSHILAVLKKIGVDGEMKHD